MLSEEYCNSVILLNNNNIKNDDFLTEHIPGLSINNFINRIIKYTLNNTSAEIEFKPWILKCSYNIISHVSDIINNNNIYNIIITSILISSKYILDQHYSNLYYANIGSIELLFLNKFEIKMLNIIKWNFFNFS